MQELRAGRTRDMDAVKPQYTKENDVQEHGMVAVEPHDNQLAVKPRGAGLEDGVRGARGLDVPDY